MLKKDEEIFNKLSKLEQEFFEPQIIAYWTGDQWRDLDEIYANIMEVIETGYGDNE